jgi:hypothetical protein
MTTTTTTAADRRLSQFGEPLDFLPPEPSEYADMQRGDRVTVARHGRQHHGIVRSLHPECQSVLVKLDDGPYLMTWTGDVLATVRGAA